MESFEILKPLSFLTEKKLKEEILEQAKLVQFKKGDIIVDQGEFVKILPIVISGQIRVFQTREEREILLYYVEPGQTCIMSLSACFFNYGSPSHAIAVIDTEILAIPARYIANWQKEYNSWNEFIIKTFKSRYDDLLDTFESVAFKPINERVLDYLNKKKGKSNNPHIKISHQELAYELGTTRVVISRILKQFELDNLVLLRRGEIQIL